MKGGVYEPTRSVACIAGSAYDGSGSVLYIEGETEHGRMVYVMSVWLGNAPPKCDLCGNTIADVFYDARLPRRRGSWASVCTVCFTLEHCSLGVGHGQRYERQDDKFVCTAGGRDAVKENKSDKQRPQGVEGSDTQSNGHSHT